MYARQSPLKATHLVHKFGHYVKNVLSKGRPDYLKCVFYLYKIDALSGKLLITEVMYPLCSALEVRLVYTPNEMLAVDRNFWLEL